jgi:Raf kinase inhibitor-like YbhB/YbcL family protein
VSWAGQGEVAPLRARYPARDAARKSPIVTSPHAERTVDAGLAWRLRAFVILAGCAPAKPAEVGSMADLSVISTAFGEGQAIPAQYSCDGEDRSPPLAWPGAPDDGRFAAILVTDPDAGGFIHWSAVNVEGSSLAEGASGSATAGVEGSNGFGRTGWGGPCPPSGEHRYVFTVYALSERLDLGPGFDADQLRSQMRGKVLAQGQLMGRYRRAGR